MKLKLFSLFFILFTINNILAQDISSGVRDNKRKELINFIASQIHASKNDYSAFDGFVDANVLNKDGVPSIEYKNKDVSLSVYFGGVYNPARVGAKITSSFLVDDTGDFILCDITGDPDTVDRLNGILKSLPAIKGCIPNSKNGDWDNCQYMI